MIENKTLTLNSLNKSNSSTLSLLLENVSENEINKAKNIA